MKSKLIYFVVVAIMILVMVVPTTAELVTNHETSREDDEFSDHPWGGEALYTSPGGGFTSRIAQIEFIGTPLSFLSTIQIIFVSGNDNDDVIIENSSLIPDYFSRGYSTGNNQKGN
jgi:hypothetical protein